MTLPARCGRLDPPRTQPRPRAIGDPSVKIVALCVLNDVRNLPDLYASARDLADAFAIVVDEGTLPEADRICRLWSTPYRLVVGRGTDLTTRLNAALGDAINLAVGVDREAVWWIVRFDDGDLLANAAGLRAALDPQAHEDRALGLRVVTPTPAGGDVQFQLRLWALGDFRFAGPDPPLLVDTAGRPVPWGTVDGAFVYATTQRQRVGDDDPRGLAEHAEAHLAEGSVLRAALDAVHGIERHGDSLDLWRILFFAAVSGHSNAARQLLQGGSTPAGGVGGSAAVIRALADAGFLPEFAAMADALDRIVGMETEAAAAPAPAAAPSAKDVSFPVDLGQWPSMLPKPEPELKPKAAPKPKRRRRRRPVALLMADVPGWAFDRNNRDIAKRLHAAGFTPRHWYVVEHVDEPPPDDYDVVFAPFHGWGCVPRLPKGRRLGSLRSQHFRPADGGMSPDDADFVRSFVGFHVVNQRAYDDLRALGVDAPPLMYLTNPVEMSRVGEPTKVQGVVASWNGNAAHRTAKITDVKGFYSVVLPAVEKAGVPFVYAEYNLRRLPMDEMPDFYRQGSVALCASLYEGASNSVMEAMAAGQALITTDVGNHREMYDSQINAFGESGIFLVDRTVDAFADALCELAGDPALVARMGEINRAEIAARWSWNVWADRYVDFFRMPL